MLVGSLTQLRLGGWQLPSWYRRGGCGIKKKAAKTTLINAARYRACASRAPQTGAKRERDSAKHKKWSAFRKVSSCVTTPAAPSKGGFAASLLMSRPPLLFEEGSCATPVLDHNHRPGMISS